MTLLHLRYAICSWVGPYSLTGKPYITGILTHVFTKDDTKSVFHPQKDSSADRKLGTTPPPVPNFKKPVLVMTKFVFLKKRLRRYLLFAWLLVKRVGKSNHSTGGKTSS